MTTDAYEILIGVKDADESEDTTISSRSAGSDTSNDTSDSSSDIDCETDTSLVCDYVIDSESSSGGRGGKESEDGSSSSDKESRGAGRSDSGDESDESDSDSSESSSFYSSFGTTQYGSFEEFAEEYYVLNNMYSEENYLEAFGGEVVGIVDKISIFGEF